METRNKYEIVLLISEPLLFVSLNKQLSVFIQVVLDRHRQWFKLNYGWSGIISSNIDI